MQNMRKGRDLRDCRPLRGSTFSRGFRRPFQQQGPFAGIPRHSCRPLEFVARFTMPA
jgi:hypothetical protein